MALYPEVQKKAQAEIDSVVGLDDLPSFEHRKDLPYVQCILLETLRWQPVVPMGLPHCSVADEIYEGYNIPAGEIHPARLSRYVNGLHRRDNYPGKHMVGYSTKRLLLHLV